MRAKLEGGLYPVVFPRALCSLHRLGYTRAIGPNLFKVNGRSDNIDVIERKLRAVREYLAIAENHCIPVKIQPVAIAACKNQVLEMDDTRKCPATY